MSRERLAVLADMIQVYAAEGGDPADLQALLEVLQKPQWLTILFRLSAAPGWIPVEKLHANSAQALRGRGMVDVDYTNSSSTKYRATARGRRIAAALGGFCEEERPTPLSAINDALAGLERLRWIDADFLLAYEDGQRNLIPIRDRGDLLARVASLKSLSTRIKI